MHISGIGVYLKSDKGDMYLVKTRFIYSSQDRDIRH